MGDHPERAAERRLAASRSGRSPHTVSDQREPAVPGRQPGLVDERADSLRADCANCFALCCVAPAFAASADFALDKPAGRACPNLRSDDFGCGVHTRLRDIGFSGCTVYDCFGAGQKVAQVTYAGQDWRRAPHTAKQMFRVFPIMRDLHELLRYLHEARSLAPAHPIHGRLRAAYEDTERLTRGEPAELLRIDIGALRQQLNPLLLQASELVRAGVGGKKKDRRGADLIGARLKGADLRGASLRGAYLIGADLRGADLRLADVIGADFRDADLRGADLTDALYLIQSQLDAAKGDPHTTLPPTLTRPTHWT
jgi:uncharacterized protein YjbI with pentapeptide repeats